MKMHAIVFSAVIWYFSARNVFWYVVIQLVEALHYKPEGHSFNSWWYDGVIGIVHWRNPSSYTMALGSGRLGL